MLIDSGHEPTNSRAVMEAVKKLTPMPVRFLIDTEPHPDHTTGHFVSASTATIIAAAGAGNRCETANARRRIGLKSRVHVARNEGGAGRLQVHPTAGRVQRQDDIYAASGPSNCGT